LPYGEGKVRIVKVGHDEFGNPISQEGKGMILVKVESVLDRISREKREGESGPKYSTRADAMFRRSMQKEEADLFIDSWHALCNADHCGIKDGLYDWRSSLSDLKRFCDGFGFSRWNELIKCVVWKGNPIKENSLKTTAPTHDNVPSFKEIMRALCDAGLQDPDIISRLGSIAEGFSDIEKRARRTKR
jgi:hypothetical protein